MKLESKEPSLVESALVDSLMPALLAGIASVPSLGQNLVLKGGSAIRQFYFADARYSNDLDFSICGHSLDSDSLASLVQEAAFNARRFLAPERHVRLLVAETERAFKPVSMRSFQFVYDWSRGVETRIDLEISLDERIVRKPERMPLLNQPSRVLSLGAESTCLVYSAEELLAEKLRALLQWTRQLETVGRRDMPVSRTYFDLHFLLARWAKSLDSSRFAALLTKKCQIRGVDFRSPACFFNPGLEQVARLNWLEQLASVVHSAPPSEALLGELRAMLEALFPPHANVTHSTVKLSARSHSD